MDIQTTARNADLGALVEMLRCQADVRYDVVAPAGRLRYENGNLLIVGGAVEITDEGVSTVSTELAPTAVFEDGIAEKLGIPRRYLHRLRDEAAPDLLDHNVNEWLERDERQFLVRGFRTDDPGETGIARAFLSDHFQALDNLDVLFGALDGVRKAGVEVQIKSANLTERQMRVNVTCPEIAVHAGELLRNYRSPFNPERTGRDYPMVWSGFTIGNSETGGGAYSLTPRIEFEVCTNGMTVMRDVSRRTHIGGQLEEGVVRWSEETQRKNLDLVVSQTADAVATFLDADYVRGVLEGMADKAASPVEAPLPLIESVGRQLGFTKGEQESILSHFISGGDTTAGGILQAVTATAQIVENPDRAAALEDSALSALELAAA